MSIYLVNDFQNLIDPTREDVENAQYYAEAGNIEAQYHLALMYDAGRGLARNPREAEKWYKKASDAGHGAAKYYLAKMYSTQQSGIRQDAALAQRLFKESADLGYIEAIKLMAN